MIVAILFTILIIAALLLNIMSLPGNWLILIFLLIWKLLPIAVTPLSWTIIAIVAALAVVGEVIEFAVQLWSGKKYGASNKGNLGGVIGAIIGAVLGAPFFFGLASVVTGLLGAYGGCYIFERFVLKRPAHEAHTASVGVFWGKFFGLAVKLGLGSTMVYLSISNIWGSI